MATKKVYDACCRRLQEVRLCSISSKCGIRQIRKPDMRGLFGKKELVTEIEFERCSEREKSRHLREDYILGILYIELNPYFKDTINHAHGIAATKDF